MNLDLNSNLSKNINNEKSLKSFMNELTDYIENNITKNSQIEEIDYKWNNLLSEDLTLYNQKITTKYRDEMLVERARILKEYAEKTKERGEMLYIYDKKLNDLNMYNILIIGIDGTSKVIEELITALPAGAQLGSVLRKQNENYVIDDVTTKSVGKEINNMINGKIEEQKQYLKSVRVEEHSYKVGEKYLGRIWLYDLDNEHDGQIDGIEETEFPKDLYELANEGDIFIYMNGQYIKKVNEV